MASFNPWTVTAKWVLTYTTLKFKFTYTYIHSLKHIPAHMHKELQNYFWGTWDSLLNILRKLWLNYTVINKSMFFLKVIHPEWIGTYWIPSSGVVCWISILDRIDLALDFWMLRLHMTQINTNMWGHTV